MWRLILEDLGEAIARRFAWVGRGIAGGLRGCGWIMARLPALWRLALLAAVLWLGYRALQPAILVAPLEVAAGLRERAPSGQVLSLRIADAMAGFGRALEELKAESDSARPNESFELPAIEIPGLSLSLRSLVEIVRQTLGISELRVSGESFLADSPLQAVIEDTPCTSAKDHRFLHLRLRSDRGESYFEGAVPLCGDNTQREDTHAAAFDRLLLRASLATYTALNPCGAAAYYFRNWRRVGPDGRLLDATLEKAERLIGDCLLRNDVRDAGYAYYLQGRILQAAGRPIEAIDSFRSGLQLHDRRFALRLRDWINRRLTDLGLAAIPSYRPGLHVHWGNALLDIAATADARRGDYVEAAKAEFEKALRRDRHVALGYAGLGNALGELALLRSEPALDIAAACVYNRGGKRQRFDAELRHHLGNLLQRQGERLAEAQRRGESTALQARWDRVAGNVEVRRHCRGKDPMRRDSGEIEIDSAYEAHMIATSKHRKAAELDPASGRFQLAWADAELRTARALAADLTRQAALRARRSILEAEDPAREIVRRRGIAERLLKRQASQTAGIDFAVWEMLAALAADRADPAAGQEVWREALQRYQAQAALQPDDGWNGINIARAHLRRGDIEAAALLLQGLTQERPDFAPGLLWRARLELQRGRRELALGLLQRADRLDRRLLEPAERALLPAASH